MVKNRAVEKEAQHKRRIGAFQKALLVAIAVSAATTVLLIAPGLPMALAKIAGKKRVRALYADTAFKKLVAHGYIEFERLPHGRKTVRLTDAGRIELLHLEPANKSWLFGWDKQWRVVIFDIPEKYRSSRDDLRVLLERAGFYMMQHSVWVFPHDCEETIELIKSHLRLKGRMIYMVVHSIEGDERLKKHFELE